MQDKFRGIVKEHMARLAADLEATLERKCAEIVGRLERAEHVAREGTLERRPGSLAGQTAKATQQSPPLAAGAAASALESTAEDSRASQRQDIQMAARQIFTELSEPLAREQEQLRRSQQQILDMVAQIQSQLRDVLAAQICLQTQELIPTHGVQPRSAAGTPRNGATGLDQQYQALREMRRQLFDLNPMKQEDGWNKEGITLADRPPAGALLRRETHLEANPWAALADRKPRAQEDEASGATIEARLHR